mgnify:CR=1 FL=1|uniref:Crystallin beta/gamma motif-containing protein n=1 Tax=virus sp. ctd0M1 TaxID=2827993 RepID=A0A8S5RDC3_9VIRU|nr:MAG TPA: crystallin beta/gamma motif-containing protein [virus sp. ctd0M1]
MAWEIENTVTTDNKAVQPQWEIEETQPLTQSVMDAENQKMYNVPLGMDATDAKFAIDTQHGGKDKGSFLGKVWTGIDIAGSSIEEVFQDFNRAVVEHTGQLVDSLVLDKGLRYQKRMKLVEDWENGDWSYFGDKELSDEEKQGIIRRQKEKIAYIQNLRERTQKFFNKGAQIMRPDEKLDNADKFFIAASSGIVSTAEAAAVAIATKNPTVAAAAIGTTYASLKDTEYFDKAIAAGESANDASADATVAGAIEGGLEFVGNRLLLGIGKVKPIQQLGNKVISSSIAKTIQSKVGRSAIGKIASRHPQSIFGAAVKGAVTDGGEEFMQEGAGMLWENYNDVSSYSMDEILSQSLFAFAAGSVSGAGMGVVGTSIYNQKITKDNTAIKNILKENTPELTDEELQVVADNVQEALLQQGAAYDEQITNLLRKESEIDVMPDGLTAESLTADTRAMLKEKYGMSDEDINKTIDIAANYIDARNGFNETYNEYFDKMDVAGYDRTVADNAARVLAARAVAIARAEGVSTEEVRKRWNLNLTRQSYEDFKNGVPVTDNYTPRQRQIDDIMSVVPENWTPEQKKALRKGIAARARYGDLDKANFNAETAKQWFETKGAEESVKAINKRVQTIMGVLNFKEEVENVKKSKRINPQNVNPFEALVDDKLYNKIARIEKENKGDSLISFIVKRGGLKDVGGELKNMDAQKQRIGLINNKSGNSFDDIALAAWEHGYFPSHSERPTINDLLEAIDAELFGKKRYQYQEGNPFSMTEYVNSLAEQMDMLGVDYRGMTAEEAEAAYNKAAEEYSKNAKQYESEYTNTGENFDDDFTLFHEAVSLANKITEIDAERLKFERKDINPELKGRENEKVKAVKINRFFSDRENSKSVSLDDVIAALDTKVKANEKGMRVLKNSARGETATLSNKALHKMFKSTGNRLDGNIGDVLGKECIANIADIFDSAILVKTHNDEKHNSKNKIHRYANVIQSQKDSNSPAETFIVKVTVKELANGNKDLTDIEIEENGGRELAAYDLKVGRKNTAGNSLGNFAKADKATVANNSGNDIIINDLIEFVNTYTDEKININGVDRWAINSDGSRIAKTAEGLRAFYEWFGDSKVVDADGKPLVVYHGTNKKFREFDKGAIGKKHKNLYQGKGFYFTKEYYDAQNYGKTIMPVYLKIENPASSDYNLKPENDGISAAHGVWVAFEPTQIKSVNNRGSFAGDNPDIYYQDGNDKNLVVYHTINKDNLQKAIDFGGFPAPSLAIVNKDEPFNFGNGKDNIQLIGNKDLINPENGTDVYNRDVWTKTFPFATYETPTFEAARKFENDYEQYFDRVNDRGALSSLTYVAQSNPAAARDSFVNSTGAKLAYLEQTKGKEIELPKRDLSADYLKQGDIDVQFVEEVKDFDENSDREEFLQKMSEAAKRLLDRKYDNSTSRFAQKLKQKMLEMDFDANGIIYFGVADRYLNNAKRYLQTKGVEAVDYYAARDFIDEQITDENAYRQWATKQIEDKLLGEPKVEVAGELLPFTLENVTKAMVDGATQNAQDTLVYGSGKTIAAGAKALNSIEEIKVESKKLVTQEESKAKMEQLEANMEVFTKQFVKYDNENYFFARDAAYKALGTIAAKENPTIEDLQEALDYEFGEQHKYSKTLLNAGVDIAKSIRNLSRYYFEAKPQRAVVLNEFSGAIIPTDTSFDDIAQKVADAGLRVVRSDNQLEAVKEFADVYFQETAGNNVPPRGAFVERGDENIIFAFENADASTVIHELGHFFLHDMQKFADNPKTAEQLAEIYKYLGVENGTLTREQEEKFADTFEVYLLDGRAPNQILRGVFARFKKWIRNLWYEVKRLSGINITDEVRATFDEMLGGKGLDFAMQASTLKMGQMLERGNISQWQTNRAMQMLYEGEMSKADMQNLIQQLRNGMKNKEFVAALKEFENKPANSNKEVLTEWDYTVLRNQLDGLNFNRDNVKTRIEKLLKWSEPRTSGGKLVGRFPNKQLNDAFARYRELATMNKDEAKQKLQENVELIEDQMKSGGDVDIEQLIFENRLLSYNLNKISNSELLKLYDGLAESYNMGRLTDKITGDAKRERKKQMIERAKNVLTNYGAINPNIESSELKKRLARFGLSQQGWNGLLDTLSMNDERTQTGKSAISQDLEMFEAEQKKYAGIAADSELISQKLEKALSGTMNNAQSVTHYMNTELDKKVVIEWSGLIDPKERNPKYQKWQPFKRTFTKDQLIDIYMKSLDDDTREIMINDPVNQYNQAFLNKVKDELTTDDLAVADAIFKFYNENYERFNAFYEEHFGMSLPKSKYYTPRAMSVDGVTIDDKTTHGYASFSGAKKRVAVAGTGVINIQGAFRALNKYINQQNHYMGYMDKLTDINAVLANKDVKNIINSLFGTEMNKRIAYEINNLANNGNDKVDAWGKFWNKLRANYAKSVLAVKPSLAIKQLTSFPAYWENVGTKDFIAGVADFFAHPKEAIKTLGGTTLMKTRGTDIIRDFDQISKSDLFTKMKKAKGKIKWNDLLMFNIKFGDRGAIYMGGWALYKSELNKNLKAGMSEKEAKAKALEAFERITDETQQSGRLSQQSYMQSNSALRAFTMFTSSQNQYLRKEINAIRGLATGRMSKAKAAKTIFIYHVLLPVFFQVVSDGFRWDKDNDLRAAVLGSLNGWFILNKVLENVYNWITDNGNMFKTRMSVRDLVPFWGSVEDLKNDLLKFADDEMELEDVLDVIKPIGEVTGLPLKYAKDVVENAGEYADDGEYFKEGLLWLGWSPYSLRDSNDE